ncbi:MAG: hypothetical protein DCF25_15065 [Leptolyngbya foveolarum]|uniref:PsbP C-terminal domain-containing protein n=1 Tax=Leptolyngbya foveolarum TaxID=47253 RepID=A0A2W4U5H7_9CYAN|nr:MAG: hypothetical protein DCF25_15065 [Leptolyngbya foveolarum]
MASLTSCRTNEDSEAVSNGDEFINDGPAVLRNTGTDVSITVPSGWMKIGEDLRRSHDIYATQPSKLLYATVLSEDNADLKRFGLADNSLQYRKLIRDGLDNFEDETKTDVTRIDGHKALQYEIRGTVDDQAVVYLHTTVEGADGYYQVVGWTTADRYRENKDVLEDVVESFEGT